MAKSSAGARAAKRRTFLDRLARVLDEPPATVERRLSGGLRSSVRLNPLRADRSSTLAGLAEVGAEMEPVGWADDAYFLRSEKAVVVESPLFADGAVYVQNASSFLPVVALDPQPGQRILDVAASPGGKASHIAALVGNDAELWLNDALPARVAKLRSMMETYGVRYAAVTEHPGQYVDKFLEGPFDRILLDAQCTGEGMLDLRHPDALRYWSTARVEKYRRLQQRMLVSAYKLLAPGGVLVYSTCTFGPEEGEHPVDHLLRHHADAEVEPIPAAASIPGARPGLRSWDDHRFDPRLQHAVRLVPAVDPADRFFEGFFTTRLTKRPS
jgi:tRNA (cytosine49-C5)-methyltransferase